EPVLDQDGNVRMHLATDPVYDLLSSSKLFDVASLDTQATLTLSSGLDPWSTGQPLHMTATSTARVVVFDTQNALTLSASENPDYTFDPTTGTVIINASDATKALFTGAVHVQVTVLEPLRDVFGNVRTYSTSDPVQHFRYDPVQHQAVDP